MMHHNNAQFYFRNLTGPETFFFKYCVISTCTYFKPCMNIKCQSFWFEAWFKIWFSKSGIFSPTGIKLWQQRFWLRHVKQTSWLRSLRYQNRIWLRNLPFDQNVLNKKVKKKFKKGFLTFVFSLRVVQ